tara:strand:- start:1675 stop:2148 length:474 start_codon:yes stop_codon:yes gene_type:complete
MSNPWWSAGNISPLQSSRFRVFLNGESTFWAKSVTQPSVEISQSEYQLINHKIKIPGVATWNDIDIVFVEIQGKGQDLYKKLTDSGYSFGGGTDGIKKNNLNTLTIEKFSSGKGDKQETWNFVNPMIKTIKYSDLDYSSDDLVTITLTVAYDSATLT